MEEPKDVSQESSPELSEAMAESAAAEQEQEQQTEAQTGTAEQPETQQEEVKEPPFHEHPRWKEIQAEKEWYRAQLEQQLQAKVQTAPTQQEYANMTPDEERFWREIDKRAERKAEERISKMSPMIQAGLQEIAEMKVQSFRRSHSDIKPNSPEEFQVAQRIKQGYNPEDAYWAVMGPRGVQRAESKVKQEVQKKTQMKRQANVESSGVSSESKAPAKESFREELERKFKEAGL